jgi:hypothetical protein
MKRRAFFGATTLAGLPMTAAFAAPSKARADISTITLGRTGVPVPHPRSATLPV